MAEHDDLEVLGGTAPELKRRKRQHATDEHIENGGKHATELSRHRRAAASRDRALRHTSSMSGSGIGTPQVWDLRLHGEPGGPTSITGKARLVLATFYIVITFLSGHAWVPKISSSVV